MYYQNYEDYMRQILGYPINDPNIYETYNYRDNQSSENTYFANQLQNNLSETEIQALYPESYNIIYPLVCKVCQVNNEPISKQLIDKLTDEIYSQVEKNETVVNVKVEIKPTENRTRRELTPIKSDDVLKRTKQEISNTIKEPRQLNYPFLKDLIRILILQRLLGGGVIRPPQPIPPSRPPFPGGRPLFGPGIGRMNMDYSEYL